MDLLASFLIGTVAGWSLFFPAPSRVRLAGVALWAVLATVVAATATAALPAIAAGVMAGTAGHLLLRGAAERRATA